jgi:hypothetical protein
LQLHTPVPCVAVTDDPRPVAERFIDSWDVAGALTVDELLTSQMALIASKDCIVEPATHAASGTGSPT